MTGIPNQEIQNAQAAERSASSSKATESRSTGEKGKRAEKATKADTKAGKETTDGAPATKKKRGVPGEKDKGAAASSKVSCGQSSSSSPVRMSMGVRRWGESRVQSTFGYRCDHALSLSVCLSCFN